MKFQIDIRTKIIILFFTNFLLLMRVVSIYEWIVVVLLILLFIFSNQMKRAIIYGLLFLLLYSIDYFLIDLLTGKALSFFSMLAVGGRLMFPCFMIGSYIMTTTNTHAFIQGLRQWRVSEKLLLTLAVMFRFLPTIRQDYQLICQSLRIRGIILNKKDIFLKPLRFFEYITVPLLMCATRSAQDLTVAVLTKSIGSKKKTSYKMYDLTTYDWSIYGIVLILTCGIMGGIFV